jgi:hypothetical protein
VRTLVVSDLHLGARLQHSVLTRPEPLHRLLDALEPVQRLVLLGDTVDLIEGRAVHAMEEAEPVLRAIGRRLGPDREVVLIPGNHDSLLVRRWVRARGAQLAAQTEVPLAATPALSRVTSWLAPARVRVFYPGAWLTPAVWATHGHYLDRHLLPGRAFGIARGLLGRMPRTGANPLDYEHTRRPSLARFSGSLPRPLAALLDDIAELARASTMPAVPRRGIHRRLLHRSFAPFTAALLGSQMHRASIPALARVVHRLGIDCQWALFGHVHRLGPLPGDDSFKWRGPGGRPRVANSGSWVYEPLLVHRANPPHPYWPGGALLIEAAEDPRAFGLLDDLAARELH